MMCVCGSDHRYCGGDHPGAMSEREARDLQREAERADCAQLEFDPEHECTSQLTAAECSLCDRVIRDKFTCDIERGQAFLCKRCERTIRADVDRVRASRIE